MRTALPKRFPILLFIHRATAVLHILTFLTDVIRGPGVVFEKSFKRGKPEQRDIFSLETFNEVSFPSTCEALNFTNLPLNLNM